MHKDLLPIFRGRQCFGFPTFAKVAEPKPKPIAIQLHPGDRVVIGLDAPPHDTFERLETLL